MRNMVRTSKLADEIGSVASLPFPRLKISSRIVAPAVACHRGASSQAGWLGTLGESRNFAGKLRPKQSSERLSTRMCRKVCALTAGECLHNRRTSRSEPMPIRRSRRHSTSCRPAPVCVLEVELNFIWMFLCVRYASIQSIAPSKAMAGTSPQISLCARQPLAPIARSFMQQPSSYAN